MENKIHLLVSTNGGNVIDELVDYVHLPLEGGDYGILAGHAPLIGALRAGVVKYSIGKQDAYLEVSDGVASIADNEMRILVRSAEKQAEK